MQDREISYNVGTKDISNGLVDFEILSSTDYFILLKAPTNANLTLKLNSNTNQPIPLKEGFQVEFKNVGKLYLSCDAVEGESIVWGQSDGNLIIKPNPTINAIDTVTEIHQFNDILLNQLDKITNPYIFENVNIRHTDTATPVLLETLQCDMIEINICAGGYAFGQGGHSGGAVVKIDNIEVLTAHNEVNKTIFIKDCKGKLLEIILHSDAPHYISSASINKYTKKV